MRVQIRSVEDKGNVSLERIVLRVEREVDIGDFMLVRTAFVGGNVTTEVMNTFWFPDMLVNGGDIVVVYSKSGRYRKKQIGDNRQAHFFYWGQESPLWDDADVAPVLLYAPEWVSKVPQDLAVSAS